MQLQQSKRDRDRRGAAYHEAGHAVVACALGLAVTRMEIGTDGKDGSGEVDVQDDEHLPLLDRLALCVAGLEAQEVFKAPTHDLAGWGDHQKVMDLVEDKDEEDGLQLRMDAHQRAHDLLLLHEAKVHRVAKALLSHTKIDAEDAQRLLAQRNPERALLSREIY